LKPFEQSPSREDGNYKGKNHGEIVNRKSDGICRMKTLNSKSTGKSWNKWLAVIMAGIWLGQTSPASGTEVYVGVADQWADLLKSPTQWSFVQQNADGLYVNFIQLGGIGFNVQSNCNAYANLFTHKNAYIESDMNETQAHEQDYINRLQRAGFTIPCTSLNYGWSATRQNGLKTCALPKGQAPRLCLVQEGPWDIGGDILGDKDSKNAKYRSWMIQADGDSTDGPMGFWQVNQGLMQEGSYSMVKYAHSLGKKALVMVCPYGAGISGYNPQTDFLKIGESCVHMHEDHNAEPDIWSVFEYATSIAAVPEQSGGAPLNSTTGMAYYLIKHLKGDPGTLDLYATSDAGKMTGRGIYSPTNQTIRLNPSVAPGTVYHYAISIANTSLWCDYAAVLKATATGTTAAWTVQFKFAGTDITSAVMGGGYLFYQGNRVNPNTTRTVDLYLTRTSTTGEVRLDLNLALQPHQGSASVDSMQFVSAGKKLGD
jgi:hypothetical protein